MRKRIPWKDLLGMVFALMLAAIFVAHEMGAWK
jgi:hypothetical protein